MFAYLVYFVYVCITNLLKRRYYARAKTGTPIVRRVNFEVSETVTTFDEITTCMSGTSQICNAGTVHVIVSNPRN